MRREVSQSPLWIRDAATMDQFLPTNISYIVTGCRVLRLLGTHPTAAEPVVNISTQNVSVFPTTFYNCVDGGNDGCGYIKLSTIPKNSSVWEPFVSQTPIQSITKYPDQTFSYC